VFSLSLWLVNAICFTVWSWLLEFAHYNLLLSLMLSRVSIDFVLKLYLVLFNISIIRCLLLHYISDTNVASFVCVPVPKKSAENNCRYFRDKIEWWS